MVRSKLTDKFTRKTWEDFERTFKRKYKEENGKPFQGSVIQYVTSGVIQRKGLPDVEDVTVLMKESLFKKTDEEIDLRLTSYFEDENNKARGYAGAFCDICKDLTFDIPMHPMITEQIMNLEETIVESVNARNKLNNVNKLIESLFNTNKDEAEEVEDKEKKEEELGVDNEDTQEDK